MQARFRSLIAALLLALACAAPAQAQLFGRSEPQGDTAELLLRIDRLENQVRTLNGRLEETQFLLRRSEEQLKKFQQDVDFRFQELQQQRGGARPTQTNPPQPAPPAPPQRRSDLEPESGPALAEAATPRTSAGTGANAGVIAGAGIATPRSGRGDAFDPAANPDAPGAPRPLGSAASAATPPARATPQGPLGADTGGGAPLDLSGGRGREANAARPPASSAALPATTPRDEFDTASFSLQQGQYEMAETGFKTFLQRYPKDALAGEATFLLGESFFLRNLHRDAAEQFLKISTDFPRIAKAPDAMLRLGQSLEKLGAREQACAFYAEIPRKFPNANTIKASAQREARRAKC